jgi:hypothetical protein
LRRQLQAWVALDGVDEQEFAERVGAGIDESYDRAMPLWQSYAGLQRYWEQRGS